MSWSVNYIGTPENVTKALDENSAKLQDKSKEEYDEALPHLKGLIAMNYNKQFAGMGIKLVAAGHAYTDGKDSAYSNCTISITPIDCTLV